MMDPQELEPLESPFQRPRPQRQQSLLASRSCYKGPIKLCRFICLMTVLPCIFVIVPLYLRFRVFSGQMYPMSMTDMRLIDNKISPTWCQRQVVKSNTTFNAFVVPGPPELTKELVNVTMTRELELEDDMKEYWGFYLLKGSSVTVSACVSCPGASLIMIKGYKHLQECAYIGDDSSEELDELLEAHKLGLLSNTTLWEKIQELNKLDGKANDPETMKRHKAGVSFHDPSKTTNVTSPDNVPAADVTDHDSKELRAILERLHAIKEAAKQEAAKHYRPPANILALPARHRHRDANVDREERPWLSFNDLDGSTSEQIIANSTIKLDELSPSKSNITKRINDTTHVEADKDIPKSYDKEKETVDALTTEKEQTASYTTKVPFATTTATTATIAPLTTETTAHLKETNTPFTNIINIESTNDEINPTEATPSSKEIFEDVLHQLHKLGDKGKRVLMRLHKSIGVEYTEKPSTNMAGVMSAVSGSDEDLDHLRKILVEAIDEEKTRAQRQQKRRDARDQARAKRELMLGQIELKKELNEDDEARNYAAEEGLDPDGYADHHAHVNETTPNDMSNSEFWSSFSSSEEALLECAGLILNLPLTPHSACKPDASSGATDSAAKVNALTYRVPANGYYFFVFNSENEVQRNFIRARFDLQKTRYDVARTKLRECTNTTDRCDLKLDMFSSQMVVLELPLMANASLWDSQWLVRSECEPRSALYAAAALALPALLLAAAFT